MSTDRFMPVDGPYTCCETTLSGECIGFHITAPKHGSIAPLAYSPGKYGPTESEVSASQLRDTGQLLAASWDLLKALEGLDAIVRDGIAREGISFCEITRP